MTISADYVRQVIAEMKPPALQLYGGDWLRDAVSGCSLAAQGLWLRLILIMHDAKPYGHLVGANGEPLTDKQLIRLIGCTKGELMKLRDELVRACVPRRTGDAEYLKLFADASINETPVDLSPLRVDSNGVVYSKRMVKDQRTRLLRKLAPIFGDRKSVTLTTQTVGQTPDTRTHVGGQEKDSASLSVVPNHEGEGSRELSPQQVAVKSIEDALRGHTDGFALPTAGRMVAWNRDFGAAFVVAVVRDLGASLDGKNASYLQKILDSRFVAGWKPLEVTARASLAAVPEPEDTRPDSEKRREAAQVLSRDVYRFIEHNPPSTDPDASAEARDLFNRMFADRISESEPGEDRWAKWLRVCHEVGVTAKPESRQSA